MNFEQKKETLSFIKDIDSTHLYEYIFHWDYGSYDGFESRTITIFECLFKEVFLPKGFTVSTNNKGNVTPDFHALMEFDDMALFNVRSEILQLSPSDCVFLVTVAQEIRNKTVHGKYKKLPMILGESFLL